MFEPIDGFADDVVAMRAVGDVTADDYKTVLVPAVKRATEGGRKAKLLLELGDGFEGYEPAAMLADTELGMSHFGSFDRIAVVTDHDWVRRGIHLFGAFIPGDVRVFTTAESGDAEAFIRA